MARDGRSRLAILSREQAHWLTLLRPVTPVVAGHDCSAFPGGIFVLRVLVFLLAVPIFMAMVMRIRLAALAVL